MAGWYVGGMSIGTSADAMAVGSWTHDRSAICPNGAFLWIIELESEGTAKGRWRLGSGSSRRGVDRRGFRQNSIFLVIL